MVSVIATASGSRPDSWSRAVNQVVSKGMGKHQQMQWTQRGAHMPLQIRTLVLNEEWEDTFRRWYSGFRPLTQESPPVKKAA